MLIPVFVDPTFTELHTRSVRASAFGIERIRFSSAVVIAFETRAEYPPIKFTPTCLAASSSTFAREAKSAMLRQAAPPIRAAGVTEILLFTMGMPYSMEIFSPVSTRFSAFLVSFS